MSVTHARARTGRSPVLREGTPPSAEASVQAGLEGARRRMEGLGLHVPELSGKLLRPLVAYALVPPARRHALDEGFWLGALAIQMVHEASLLHDDILDDAPVRRGAETAQHADGVAAALVLGDLYLTGAYRAAAASGRTAFLHRFIDAVERTVAGELAQGRAVGRRITPESYDAMIRGKSGALFGAAAVLGLEPHDPDPAVVARRMELGERIGTTYQRIDDLLDYCTACDTGKPPLQDYGQKKWTWVLDLVDGVEDFSLPPDEVVNRLFADDGVEHGPAQGALDALQEACADVLGRLEIETPGDDIVGSVLDGWMVHASDAITTQRRAIGVRHGDGSGGVATDEREPRERVRGGASRRAREPFPAEAHPDAVEAEVRAQALALGGPDRWPDYFGRHARTFRLAARLFPEAQGRMVQGVYAWCRFTDDLVDEPIDGVGPERVRARLDAWRNLTERAWSGEATGVPVLDEVIGGAAARGVSARYPLALLDGVAMDLENVRYADWSELERYTFCVAGAVGGWMTQAFGFRDPALLECAHALGHAMQLTNIARDVGEDWQRNRVYIPRSLLSAHDLEPEDLGMLPGLKDALPGNYVRVVEAILSRADAHYARAWPAIGALPGWYKRPVAAAASAYRGIHDEIRRNGYDNLTRRAYTSRSRKLWLAATGILRALPRTPLRPAAGSEEMAG